jgi:hypothetical protein
MSARVPSCECSQVDKCVRDLCPKCCYCNSPMVDPDADGPTVYVPGTVECPHLTPGGDQFCVRCLREICDARALEIAYLRGALRRIRGRRA